MLIEQIKQVLAPQLPLNTPVREYELISLLQRELSDYPQGSLSDHSELFKCHFLVRHALYQLRNEWRFAAASELFISALYIEKNSWQAGEIGLQRYDTLADFYLNLTNLETLTEQDISLLINGFWDKFQTNIARKALCLQLEVNQTIDDSALIKAWRKTALRLHPDKGGDSEQFKQVQSAYDQWRKHCAVR